MFGILSTTLGIPIYNVQHQKVKQVLLCYLLFVITVMSNWFYVYVYIIAKCQHNIQNDWNILGACYSIYKTIYSSEQQSRNKHYFTVKIQTTKVKSRKKWKYCPPPPHLPNSKHLSKWLPPLPPVLTCILAVILSSLLLSVHFSLYLCWLKKDTQGGQPKSTPSLFILSLTWVYTVKPVYNRIQI